MKYAFTRPDGGVSILIVTASKADVERTLGLEAHMGPDGKMVPGMTDAEYEKHIREAIPADATDVKKLPENWQAPDKDRTFRNAWRHRGGVFSVDIAHAREIMRERLRAAQKPVDEGRITAAKTPDELRQIESE